MNEFKDEYYKFTGKEYKKSIRTMINIFKSHTLKYLYYSRRYQYARNVLSKFYFNFLRKIVGNKYGIEIPNIHNVGKGLLLCHAFNITVNENARLGSDVTLFKGSTLGSIRSGKKMGAPIIGDRVVIGLNATVCGNIKIGNDVFIAPNSFVNFNVPSNSIVIGNPGIIHHKDNAAADYYYSFKSNIGGK